MLTKELGFDIGHIRTEIRRDMLITTPALRGLSLAELVRERVKEPARDTDRVRRQLVLDDTGSARPGPGWPV